MNKEENSNRQIYRESWWEETAYDTQRWGKNIHVTKKENEK